MAGHCLGRRLWNIITYIEFDISKWSKKFLLHVQTLSEKKSVFSQSICLSVFFFYQKNYPLQIYSSKTKICHSTFRVLECLWQHVAWKRPNHWPCKWIFCIMTIRLPKQQILLSDSWQKQLLILEHPPYLPDLALCDPSCFWNQKSCWKGLILDHFSALWLQYWNYFWKMKFNSVFRHGRDTEMCV